jgi:hypothetical protein
MMNSHSKTRPFDFRTQIDHSKSGLVWYLHVDCICVTHRKRDSPEHFTVKYQVTFSWKKV